MRQLLLITAKDLRQGLRDRSVLMVGLVVPFTLATIFSFLFGGTVGGELDLDYLYHDADRGPLARVFVEEVLAGAAQRDGISVEAATDPATALQLVEHGDFDALFVVPEGFTAAVQQGRRTSIEVVANVDSSLGRQVAAAIAGGFAQELTGAQVTVAAVLTVEGEDAPPIDAIGAAFREAPGRFDVIDGAVAHDQLDETTYLAAGMAVFFLFFAVQFGVLSLLEERRNGTLARLYTSPFPRRTVLAAKTLTSFVLGLVSMTVLVIGTDLLLGADWGDPAGVAVLLVAGVASAVTVVLLVGTLARTAEQAGTWQSIVAIVLGMAGGVFFDVSRGSTILATISLVTPHRWFMRGLGELAGGGGPADVLPHAGGMLLFGAVMLLSTVLLSRVAGRRLP